MLERRILFIELNECKNSYSLNPFQVVPVENKPFSLSPYTDVDLQSTPISVDPTYRGNRWGHRPLPPTDSRPSNRPDSCVYECTPGRSYRQNSVSLKNETRTDGDTVHRVLLSVSDVPEETGSELSVRHSKRNVRQPMYIQCSRLGLNSSPLSEVESHPPYSTINVWTKKLIN